MLKAQNVIMDEPVEEKEVVEAAEENILPGSRVQITVSTDVKGQKVTEAVNGYHVVQILKNGHYVVPANGVLLELDKSSIKRVK